MANPGALPITLVTILLLVAPGYLAIRVFLWRAERNYTLDRTEKIVWSSATSLASLFLLYLMSPVLFPTFDDVGSFLLDQLGFIGYSSLGSVSLPTSVLLYLTHLALLLVSSELVAIADIRQTDDDRDRREPWRYAFDDAGEGRIEVFLEDGSRIRGEFDPSAWDSSRKDLYLRDPVRLGDNKSVGRSMLVRSEWITRVVFPVEDPDEEQMKRSREIGGEMREQAEEAVEELPQSDASSSETDDAGEPETTEDRDDGSED